MAIRVGRGHIMNDAAVGDRGVLLVGNHRQIERGFKRGFIKPGKHHTSVRAFELRDSIGPPRGLAQVHAAQPGSKLA